MRQAFWHYVVVFEGSVISTLAIMLFLFPPTMMIRAATVLLISFGLLAFLLAWVCWDRLRQVRRNEVDPEYAEYQRLRRKFER